MAPNTSEPVVAAGGRRVTLPRNDTWQLLLPRVLGLVLVLAALPFVKGLAWDAATCALVALLSVSWAAWCALSARSEPAACVPEAWAVPPLAVAVVSGNLLVTLKPAAALGAVIVIMAVMSSGAALSTLVSVGVLAAGILAVAVGAGLSTHPGQTWALAGWSSLLLAGHLAGTTRRSLRIQQMQAEELLIQARRVHREEQRAAALAERTRIAREIHDVLAHSLGALAVQLDLTDSLLTADPPRNADAIRRVADARRIAIDGLTETRRAIATLRSDSPPLPEALAALVREHLAGSGAPASFELEGTPRPLTPEITLALLRVTQEALTNAAKHAPGRELTARLRYGLDCVDLSVLSGNADAAAHASVPGVNGGYGLAGMRERLLLVGGELTAGPSPIGWRVRARVPA